MKTLLAMISGKMEKAFEQAGYDKKYGRATLSNRPDLCEFQCNGALAAAKAYKKAPIVIAGEVEAILKELPEFSQVQAVAPGFLNLKLRASFLREYLSGMQEDDKFGLAGNESPCKIIIDYGGPNVAKPLHVGICVPPLSVKA
mgnify:CR=1 FL=1